MQPSTGGPGVASPPLRILLAAAILALGCESVVPSQAPTPAPTRTAPATQRLPTPVPTAPSTPPGPGPSEPAPTGLLLLRLTTCDDACGPLPGTTVLDDGTIIWQPPEGRVLEGRLTAAGLAAVREAIASEPALAADGTFVATLRPGAEPPGHGVSSHRFDVAWPTGPVVVNAWDPDSLADQLDAWVVPPALDSLDELASMLANPVAWLGREGFAEAPAPYAPDRYMVVIDLFPDIGEAGAFPADVDAVDWPFGNPIEAVGEPIGPGQDGPAPRCLILASADAEAMRAAEADAGAARDLRQWITTNAYEWRRADGFVQVTTIQLLPHEHGACADLVVSPP